MADSKVARGTAYEKYVQDVYQALLVEDGVDTVEVQHNIKLLGNSGCEHQIDVYWEYRLAGQLYRTAIECKAFDKTVGVGRVRDFYGVVSDIPGLTGVIATRNGFQAGAIKFAAQHGISLQEVREPKDTDWAGSVRKIDFRIHVVMLNITDFRPRPSRAFVASLKPGEEFRLDSNISTHDPIIFDAGGASVASYEELRQMLPHERKSARGLRHFVPYPNHIYRTNAGEFEIDGVDIIYDVAVDTSLSVIESDASAVIKDVASDKLTFVAKDGSVKRPRA